MFSYSGLSKEQVQRLREEFSVYAIDSGRICVAALNSRNVDYVADAIAKVVKVTLGGEARVGYNSRPLFPDSSVGRATDC